MTPQSKLDVVQVSMTSLGSIGSRQSKLAVVQVSVTSSGSVGHRRGIRASCEYPIESWMEIRPRVSVLQDDKCSWVSPEVNLVEASFCILDGTRRCQFLRFPSFEA